MKYKNRIRFNCTAFVRLFDTRPANCYNCMKRNGYPQNLGGDKNCENYTPIHPPKKVEERACLSANAGA